MLSNQDANRLMAKGLGETGNNNEQNRQIVAASNFIWRADQLLWRREDANAKKMLVKAESIAARIGPIPPDMLREIRIRTRLIADRSEIFPLLLRAEKQGEETNIAMFGQFRLQIWDANNVPSGNWEDQVDLLDYVRGEAFGNDFYFENDNRDQHCRFAVALFGDEVVGAARWRETASEFPDLSGGYPIAILDQIFVSAEFRRLGLAQRLFDQVKLTTARTMPLFLLLKKSWKLYAAALTRVARTHRVLREDVFVPNLNCAGGTFISLLEPSLNVM